MLRSIVATALVALLAVDVSSLPMDVPATDLVPPKFENEQKLATDLLPPESENGPVPATELLPAPLSEEVKEKKIPAMLFVINIVAVKNRTAEDSNDVLHNDVIGEVPSEVAVPLALFLLVLEDEDENHPVSLDDIAKDLQKEGFPVEKVVKDGETRMVKVDVDTFEKTIPESSNMLEHDAEIQESGKLTSVRRKRHLCLHCKLEELKEKIHNKHHGGGYGGGYGGGGCGGGCGGGGGNYYPQQPIYQPVQVQPVYQPVQVPVYQQPRPYYPEPQHGGGGYCNTCGGGGYGNGGGGGNAYAQASAQASASSSSGGGGWGR